MRIKDSRIVGAPPELLSYLYYEKSHEVLTPDSLV